MEQVYQKKVLHVGCGPKRENGVAERFKDYKEIRLDLDPKVEPDFCCSMTDMSIIGSSTMDAIFSAHNLEHLYHHEVPLALDEFYRVLVPGGEVILTVPDLVSVIMSVKNNDFEAELYKARNGESISALDCLYGQSEHIAKGNTFMSHKTGFTAQTLGRHFDRAGFAEVTVFLGPMELWVKAIK